MPKTPDSSKNKAETKESVNTRNPKEYKSENYQDDNYMSEKSNTIGKNIRSERKLRNFSVENLAEFLELSISYIGLLERGDRCPSLKIVYKLCDLFGSTPNDILIEKRYDEKIHRIFVAEDKSASNKYRIEAIMSLINTLTESELDFVLAMTKNLKKVNRQTGGV